MSSLEQICKLIADILDLDPADLGPNTYLARDLNAESIDFLELGVAINTCFHIEVSDERLFLTALRTHLAEATRQGLPVIEYLRPIYPALSDDRFSAILSDLEKGPAVQIKDLVCYVDFAVSKR